MRGRDIGSRARAVVVQPRLWLSAVLALAAPLALAQHQAYNLPPQVPAAQLQPLEQQRRQLFERLLTEPGDTDASFAYAVLATQLGDYEAAIATYERLLIQHPNTARIQLELAAVYFRLGALVQARQLFEQVLQRPDTPDNVRLRVMAIWQPLPSSAASKAVSAGASVSACVLKAMPMRPRISAALN